MSNYLWPHELQHARLSCPSLSSGVCLNSCSLSQWYHQIISSSVVPFVLAPSFTASMSVPVSQLFTSSGQKYWSFSISISPSDEYSVLISFRNEWFVISLLSQGTLKSLLQHHILKASILCCSAFFVFQLSYPCMTTGKTIVLTIWTCFLICCLDLA